MTKTERPATQTTEPYAPVHIEVCLECGNECTSYDGYSDCCNEPIEYAIVSR